MITCYCITIRGAVSFHRNKKDGGISILKKVLCELKSGAIKVKEYFA